MFSWFGSKKELASQVLVVASVVLGLVVALLGLWLSIQILLLTFAGVLVAVMLSGMADGLRVVAPIPKRAALVVVLVVIIAVTGGVLLASKQGLEEQFTQLIEQLPVSVDKLLGEVSRTRLGKLVFGNKPDLQSMVPQGGDLVGGLAGAASSFLEGLVAVSVVVFVGIYLAFSPTTYLRGVAWMMPASWRPRLSEVLGAVGYTLKWWLLAQAFDMVVVGLSTWLGLWWIGVPQPAILGLIAGLLNFIPNFGPLLAGVPAVLLALGTDDPYLALWVIGLFTVLQSIEGYLLMPFIQSKAVDMPEAMTILAQVLIGGLTGGLGLALAAPLAAAGLVVVKMLWVEDAMGSDIGSPADGEARAEIISVQRAVPRQPSET